MVCCSLEGHLDEQEDLNDLLLKAAWDTDTAVIKFLLQQGADVNFVSEEGTALLIAVQACADSQGCCEAVSLLINHGASVNAVDA